MKKNLLSEAQSTLPSHFVLFNQQSVKVCCDLEILEPVMTGWMLESIYVISTKTTYVVKTGRMRWLTYDTCGWVTLATWSYIWGWKKSELKGLSQLAVRTATIKAGC